MREENQLVWMSKGARETKFHDCLSKVVITDQFTKDYMDIFLKYPIAAQLVDKRVAA